MDAAIAEAGADFPISAFPDLNCAHCGGTLDIKLAFAAQPYPDEDEEE
jgi:hypothetical protein